ncbi:rho GTPase-activating protein [Zygosaccharomyces mellis]|uniref:Rho GTPase-activating protein n=1 Tax=Zygosaccharomyces mellis TaxID=42258 RepID=A0A4C2E3P2_9SACH|nr:rho GTPase-activating protein [Zygosaccharomyces mellis]
MSHGVPSSSHPMSSSASTYSNSTLHSNLGSSTNYFTPSIVSSNTTTAGTTGGNSGALGGNGILPNSSHNQSHASLLRSGTTNTHRTAVHLNKDNYDNTTFKVGWLNRSHGNIILSDGSNNSSSVGGNRRDSKMFDQGFSTIAESPISVPDYRLYRVQLKGPFLSLYKSGLSNNVKCFDPNLGTKNTEGEVSDDTVVDVEEDGTSPITPVAATTSGHSANIDGNISTGATPTTTTFASSQPQTSLRNNKSPMIKHLSPLHPHPDLKTDRDDKIVSGTIESLCHAILFSWPHTSLEDTTTSSNRYLINLLLSLPLLDDFFNFLSMFRQMGLTFTKHSSKISNNAMQYCNISPKLDDQITNRLALVVKTLLDMFPSFLLDEQIVQQTMNLLETIALHDNELSNNLKVAVKSKHDALNILTAFSKGPAPTKDNCKAMTTLLNPEKFLKMDAKQLAAEVHEINLKFRKQWGPRTDYSLLYDSKFINSKIVALNPLVFNNNDNIHFLGRLFVSHVFSEPATNSPKFRGKILSKWVDLGVRFEHLGDMVSWLALATIVCSIPILRLYQAWQYVSEHTIRVIFKDWVPTIAQLNRRQLSSRSTSSVFILAPPNLEDPVIRSNVISYFGDLIIHADDLPAETKLKYLEKKINRTNNAFHKWQQRLDSLSRGIPEDEINPINVDEMTSGFYQFWKYHLSLPPLNMKELMDLSTKVDAPRVDQQAYSAIGSQRSPLLTGSYLPVLFNELLSNYSLFSRESLIGAAGVISTTMNATTVPNATYLTRNASIGPKSPMTRSTHNLTISDPIPLDINDTGSRNTNSGITAAGNGDTSATIPDNKKLGNQITGIEHIDGPVVKAMSSKQSNRQHLLKCVRDAFNIDSDIFRISNDFIFKSCNDSDLMSANSSTVIENPKRFSQNSYTNSNTLRVSRESQDMANTLSKSLQNIDFFNKDSETLKESIIPVVLKSGSLDKIFDLLVLTAGVFSRLVETKDLENYFLHNKERNTSGLIPSGEESKDENLGLLDFAFIRLSMDNETFTETFFNTYRSFTTTKSVLENLAKRYIGAKSCALSISRLLNGSHKIKSSELASVNDQKFPVWDMKLPPDEAVNYANWAKIQVGAAESLSNLVKNHYADFTDDTESNNTLLDIVKIMENDVNVEWSRRMEQLKRTADSADLKETRKFVERLSELFVGIRSAYQKQMYRPLGINRTQRKVTDLLDSVKTRTMVDYRQILSSDTLNDSMVSKFHELKYNDYEGILDWVYALDDFILERVKLVSKQDWFATYQVLELFSYESLTSYFSFPQHSAAYTMITSGSSQLDDLEIMNIFSWISDLITPNGKPDSYLLKKLPESVQLLINLHLSLTSFFTVEISDTTKDPDNRLKTCAVILQVLNYVRWKNSSLDLFEEETGSIPRSISPHIPSFIETAVSDAIISPESRFYEHTWRAAHSLLSCRDNDYLPSICRLLDNIDDKHIRGFVEHDSIYMAKPKNLCVCAGWLIMRLVEIAQFVPNMSTMNSKLINFDKRRFVSNIISNIMDLIPVAEDYTSSDKNHRDNNFGTCLSLKVVDYTREYRKSTRVVSASESKMLKFQENGLFNEILSEEVEKIRRDHKKIEALSVQEHDNKRSAVLQKVVQRKPKSSVMVPHLQVPTIPSSPSLNSSPSPTFGKDKRSSVTSLGARNSIVSNSGHNHVGRKLGGFFRRPFSIGGFNSSASNSSLNSILVPDVQPNGTVAPLNLPSIENSSINDQKPIYQFKTFEIENIVELMNVRNPGYVHGFKIVMQGGQEVILQAVGSAELKQWVKMIKASRRYSYYSKKYKSKTYNKIFGVPLEDLCEREGTVIPNIVVKLLEEIELRGLDEVGLYRIPGSVGSVNALKSAFDEEGGLSNSFTLEDDRWFEINAIAGCFKMYLRELPECLFTNERVQAFANLALQYKSHQMSLDEFIQTMGNLLKTLPLCYYHTFKRIVIHLNKVHQHVENNRMDASNLAIVFSMSFINQEDLANSMGSTLGAIQTILQLFIKSPGDFFE